MRFRSTYPGFSLKAPAYGVTAQFVDGHYETDDKTEIRLLSEQSNVEIVETKADLYEEARGLGIEGRSEMSRDELAEEVIEETVPPKEALG